MARNATVQDRGVSLLRMSVVLNELSRELQQASSKPQHLAHPQLPATRSLGNALSEDQALLGAAEQLYRNRRRWEKVFGSHSDLLHDPALDIMLYLFIGLQQHSEISVSSACYAANVPQTTGLRYIAKLTERGLVERTDDPFDRRRHLLSLTDAGEALLRRCFETH